MRPINLELVLCPDTKPGAEIFLHIKRVALVIIGKLFVQGMLCNVVLFAEEWTHAAKLEHTERSIHHGKFIHRHQVFSEFLVVLAKGRAVALGFAVRERVDCFPAKDF